MTAIGALVLGGWALDLELLKSVIPGAAEMKPNVAVALLLCGLMLAIPSRRHRLLAPAAGILVGVLGLATLAEYMAGVDLGIDQALFRDHAATFNAIPGRMSPFTAWALVLTGACLVCRRSRSLAWLAALCAAQVMLVGACSVLGCLWNAADLATDAWVPAVAVHTGIAFLALGTGMALSVRRLQTPKFSGRPLSRSERATRVAFWSMVAVLLTASSYTYRSNINFVHAAQAVAETEMVRLELSRLQVCAQQVDARHTRLLILDSSVDADLVTRSMAECRRFLLDLKQPLASDPAHAHEFALLGAALERQFDTIHANHRLLAESGLAAARAAWARASVEEPLRQMHSSIQAMDGVQAGRLEEQLHSRTSDRAAMLVSLLVTLFACLTIFAALARVMLDKVRENTRAREETERQKLLLTAVINSSPDPVAYRASDGTYLGANEAYARMVGRPVSALVGATLADVFGPARAAEIGALDTLVVAGDKPSREEDWYTYPDGSRQVMEMIRSPLRDTDARISGVLFVGRNVTLRKVAQEQAEQARALAEEAAQLKTAFLANMSHEIRSPMTAVLGLVDLLAADDLSERQQRYVEAMRTSGRHLLSIINDILDFSRIEAGKLQLESVDFSLPALLEELRSLVHPMVSERDLALEIELQPQVPAFVRGDPTRVRQVLLNLASNAIKFTPHGSVRIVVTGTRLAAGDALIAFEVSDTGIGIEADKLRTLFSPFMQADQSIARQYGGSGLGLAISQRLADAMGGRLSASSVPGQGSTFRLALTLAVGEGAVDAPVRNSFDRALEPRRILVAEDVEINRDLLRAALTRQGHHVDFAVNGAEAVARVQSAPYDLVLMDVQMPVLDGVEATRRIRRLAHPVRDIPILGLTANVLAMEQQHYLAAGMDECLPKPIDWQQLAAAIARHGGGTAAAPVLPPATAAPSAQPSSRWIDAQRLAPLRAMATEEELAQLVAKAFGSVTAAGRAIVSATALDRVAAEAHKLKGLSGTMGFAAVYETASRIEAAAIDGGRAEDAIALLHEHIECTATALRSLGLLAP